LAKELIGMFLCSLLRMTEDESLSTLNDGSNITSTHASRSKTIRFATFKDRFSRVTEQLIDVE
jgi:hypothetical protein